MQEIGGSIDPRSANPRGAECAKGIFLRNLLRSTLPNDQETVTEGKMRLKDLESSRSSSSISVKAWVYCITISNLQKSALHLTHGVVPV